MSCTRHAVVVSRAKHGFDDDDSSSSSLVVLEELADVVEVVEEPDVVEEDPLVVKAEVELALSCDDLDCRFCWHVEHARRLLPPRPGGPPLPARRVRTSRPLVDYHPRLDRPSRAAARTP